MLTEENREPLTERGKDENVEPLNDKKRDGK